LQLCYTFRDCSATHSELITISQASSELQRESEVKNAWNQKVSSAHQILAAAQMMLAEWLSVQNV